MIIIFFLLNIPMKKFQNYFFILNMKLNLIIALIFDINWQNFFSSSSSKYNSLKIVQSLFESYWELELNQNV